MNAALPSRLQNTLTAAAALTYALLIVTALAGAIAASLIGVDPQVPRDSIDPTLSEVGILIAHNATVAGIPIALALAGYDKGNLSRPIGDLVVAVLVLANGANIGIGFAQAGADLLPYLPHLPAEWGAIAFGAGTWISLRLAPEGTDRRGVIIRGSAVAGTLVVVAAFLEAMCSPVVI